MELLQDSKASGKHRTTLMNFLNENGLDGTAILAISRHAEVVSCEPDEFIFSQGQVEKHIYFLVEGQVGVRANVGGSYRELGERAAVCVLGEIGYFNGTAPSADVVTKGSEKTILFRLGYDNLSEIIERDPRVKDCLNRFGEMRLITQNNGFASYSFFMEMIGWKRNRFLLDHQVLPDVEQAVKSVLMPKLEKGHRILEVGDGPGIISEILLDMDPEILDGLQIFTTGLESAVTDPFTPRPSDLSKAKFSDETFDTMVALQVFNVVHADQVVEQFKIAHRLIKPGGYLFLLKVRLVNIKYAAGSSETQLFFELLETLADQNWPGARGDSPIIETTFMDADLDPLMGWNKALCVKAAADELQASDEMSQEDRELLERFLVQAKAQVFNPDTLHFHWLSAKALQAGFTVEEHAHQADLGFYYQMLYRF